LISGTNHGELEFNDGGTPDNPTDDYFIYTPEHNFYGHDSFVYEICDIDGDCDQANVNIFVINDGVLFIPEVITPNGDGINDYFVIEDIESYPESSLIILNRWGDKIFEASPYNNDWNGLSNFGIKTGGNKLPEGTYFYILKTGDKKVLKGYVYLKL
jgi:large repetitive protein